MTSWNLIWFEMFCSVSRSRTPRLRWFTLISFMREPFKDSTMRFFACRDWNRCKAVMRCSGRDESLTDRRLKSEKLALPIVRCKNGKSYNLIYELIKVCSHFKTTSERTPFMMTSLKFCLGLIFTLASLSHRCRVVSSKIPSLIFDVFNFVPRFISTLPKAGNI